MAKSFELLAGENPDGSLVLAGPMMTQLKSQLTVPSLMLRRVRYEGSYPDVELGIVFTGERLEISELRVSATSEYVTSHFLTQLGLPRIIRQAAIDNIPHSHLWLSPSGQPESYEFLAQLYWFEYISWGSPRAAIMDYMGWSRPNTNWHLRKIGQLYDLPRPPAPTQSDDYRGN